MSKIIVYNPDINAVLDPKIITKTSELEEFSIENKNILASFNRGGLLKNITIKSSGKQYPVSLKFVK